jgi:Mn-dependent DtxR family transcriptional regulator
MSRNPNQERLDKIYRKIKRYQGKRPGVIARLLGLNRSTVLRALPALEKRGLLISEDDRGGLWIFHKGK